MSVKCRVLKCGYAEITQGYANNGHLGIDIVAKGYTLDNIVAHSKGTVTYIQTGYKNAQGSTGMASYGNMVKISHNNGYESWYAHLDTVSIKKGQTVSEGQIIGYMGNTGNSYGGHLHFEVHKNGTRINPTEYLDKSFENPVTSTVARDESKNQLKVNVSDLRVRKSPATNQEILGLAKENGIYNYYETKTQGGYNWYRIADGQWLANSDNWCTIYPKKEVEDETVIAELQKQVEQLTKEKQELTDRNKLLEQESKDSREYLEKVLQEHQETLNKVLILETEYETLKEQDEELDIFVAPKTGTYAIDLKQEEFIKYKK